MLVNLMKNFNHFIDVCITNTQQNINNLLLIQKLMSIKTN